jgi:hypothetical protein
VRGVPTVLATTGCLLLAGCGGAVDGSGSRTARAELAAARYGVEIQATVDPFGDPQLTANFRPDAGLAEVRWSICSPPDVTRCTRTHRAGGLQPGEVAPGTVFAAIARYHGHTYRARTVPWGGRLRAAAPPRLEGRPEVGAAVEPAGASWTGGWGSEFSRLRVQACRTITGKHCVTLSAEGEAYPGRGRRAVIRRRYVGWYLFAYDQRLAHDTIFATPAYGSAEAVPPLQPGPTVAPSAPIGPVTAAASVPAGSAPWLALPPRCARKAPGEIPPSSWRRARRVLAPEGASTIRLCRYSGLNAHPALRLLRSSLQDDGAVVQRIVREFDALRRDRGVHFCPADDRGQIIALLAYPHRRLVTVSVGLSGCHEVTNGAARRTAFGFYTDGPGSPRAFGPQLVSYLKRLTA